MALQDLLTAITKEADQQIAAFKQVHSRAIADAKAKAEEAHVTAVAAIDAQKRQKMDQMRRKAQQHAEAFRRNAVLQRKCELLDQAYAAVLDALSNESDANVEPLLKACLARVHDGEIRAAKKHAALLKTLILGTGLTLGEPVDARGGFLCVSKTQEYDFRFETIVSDLLRPRTELRAAHDLFSAQNT